MGLCGPHLDGIAAKGIACISIGRLNVDIGRLDDIGVWRGIQSAGGDMLGLAPITTELEVLQCVESVQIRLGQSFVKLMDMQILVEP